MRYCQACRVTYTDREVRVMNLKMHFFPRRDWQRNFLISWLSFCGMPLQTTDISNKFVCSMHFAADDYFPGANRRLRMDAVPHLCPPSELVAEGDPTKNIATRPCKNKNLYDVGRREMVENVKRQLCRLCGKREGLLKPIFEESSDDATLDSSIATKIKMYLPVKVEDDASLPLNICSKCSDLLNEFHEMNVTCVAVDNILRESFGVDETDALFEDPDDRAQKAVMESEMYKQHLRRTVTRVVQEHKILIGAITKRVIPPEQYSSIVKESGTVAKPKKKQFMCSFCGEGFKFFKLRSKHIVICRELPGVCEVCGKVFPRKELKRHWKQSHSLPKDFMCDKCGKCFRSMQALDYHSKTKHVNKIKPDIKYYCELCCQTFCTKPSYESHQKNHENGNINLIFSIETEGLDEDSVVFKCPVCEEIFDDKLSLIVHLNAPKDAKCGICLSRFHNEKRYLVHQSSDKWMCHHCDKVFCYKHHVVAHERIHTGEKPFKCMVCDLRFRTLSHKAKHQAIHHPPQFICPYCDKQFRYKGPFENHVNLHEGKVISCTLCNKTFGGTFSLYRHNRRYHKSCKQKKSQTFEIEGFQGDIVVESNEDYVNSEIVKGTGLMADVSGTDLMAGVNGTDLVTDVNGTVLLSEGISYDFGTMCDVLAN